MTLREVHLEPHEVSVLLERPIGSMIQEAADDLMLKSDPTMDRCDQDKVNEKCSDLMDIAPVYESIRQRLVAGIKRRMD